MQEKFFTPTGVGIQRPLVEARWAAALVNGQDIMEINGVEEELILRGVPCQVIQPGKVGIVRIVRGLAAVDDLEEDELRAAMNQATRLEGKITLVSQQKLLDRFEETVLRE